MRIVVWSGGADSTLILLDELLAHRDVVAITLEHPQLGDKQQRTLQNTARTRFKRWLWEAHRMKVTHHKVEVALSKDCGAEGNVGQSGLFLNHLFPYMTPREGLSNTVLFGYIRGDDHWHGRHEFVQAFHALAKAASATMTLEYPLEWMRKPEVLSRLKDAGVPRNAWWTCDRPIGVRECEECIKCVALKEHPIVSSRVMTAVAVTKAKKRR